MSWAEANSEWISRARARWSPEHPEPLLVRAWLAAEVAYDGFDPLTIEGALQVAVCIRETGRPPDDVYSGCPVSAPLDATDIQIPIVDTVVGGIPIAHASVGWFAPDAVATKRQNWKRADAENYNQPIVKVSEAGTKTQMVLKATVTTTHVDFYVEGERAKLLDLLGDVAALGAGRSGGIGAVHGWEAIPVPVCWWWLGPGERLMRTLPASTHGDARGCDIREATLRAPYWHPRTRRTCGVPIQRLGEPLGEIAGDFFVTGHAAPALSRAGSRRATIELPAGARRGDST